MKLTKLKCGESGIVNKIGGPHKLRLSELGFNPGCKIMITNKSHVNLLVINCRDSGGATAHKRI